MINSIKILLLRNIEFIIFIKNVVEIVERNGATQLDVAAELANLKTKKEAVEVLFKLLQSNPITGELEAYDGERDEAIMGIVTVVEGYCRHFLPEISGAAKLIALHLKPYGSEISQQHYQAETGLLQEIIADWENNPELANALSVLNLTSWKDKLKTVNDLFNEKFLDRSHEYGTESPITLKQRRELVNQAYYELRDMIDAHARINKTAAVYPATIKDLNALINHYNQIIENRQNDGDGNTGETGEGETNTGGEGEITPQPIP